MDWIKSDEARADDRDDVAAIGVAKAGEDRHEVRVLVRDEGVDIGREGACLPLVEREGD